MPLKFVVKSGPSGKFAFSVMSRNGRVIATSDEYSSRAAALTGVRSIRSQAAEAPIEDQSTKAWADAEQGRAETATATKAAKAAKPAKKAPKKRPPKAAPPEPEDGAEASPAPIVRQAASFAQPDLSDTGPQRVSLRSQSAPVREGQTRRVVSMRRT